MANVDIHALEDYRPVKAKAKASAKQKAPRKTRKTRKVKARMLTPKNALIGTTLALLALSLTHLAAGIEYLCRCDHWQSWAMAIGIDLVFVSVEWLVLSADDDTKARIRGDAAVMTIITITASSALNALAFYVTASSELQYYAGGFGALIPFLVYGSTTILAKVGK
jgi:hypothetical protein